VDPISTFAIVFAFALLRYLPVMVLPGLSPLSWAPAFIRIILLLAFSWLTVLALPDTPVIDARGWPVALVLGALGELLIGLVFGLGFMLPNAALHTSGWLLDMQAGLGAATLFNPGSGSGESLLGHALMLAAAVLFFTLDLHVLLFKGIAASQSWMPLGSLSLNLQPEAFFTLLGSSFLSGLMVVAPVVIGLLCIDLAIAYASRSMPQANIYFLALPLKVAAAIGLLALTLAYAPTLIGRLIRDAFDQAPAVLGVR
jgi:flagellar biosynthetic protein FliR